MRLRDVAVVLTLAGCGQVSDNKNMPDAPADAPDTAAPMIIDSHPTKDAKGVSVIAPVSIVLDEEPDAATVTNATIKLRYATKGVGSIDYNIFGTFVYDNAVASVPGTVTLEGKKITFAPLAPLPFNAHAELMIDGVKDKFGNALSTKLAFDTPTNATRNLTIFNNGVVGNVATYYDTFVINGLSTNYSQITSSGTDLIWFTSDDVRNAHRSPAYDMSGRWTANHYFTIGTDNMWNTPDDVETSVNTFTYDAQGRIAYSQTSTNAGTDTIWGTADDVPSSRTVVTYQGDNLISQAYITAAGLDGMWGTTDDLMPSATYTFFKYQYDSSNHRTRQITYQAGTDRIPSTNDDVVSSYIDITTDARGNVTRMVTRNAGPNNLWFDGDDAVTGYTDTVRDMRGIQTETKYYNTAGANGTWLDSDDHMGSHITDTLNAAGQLVDETTWNAGANGILGDSDDVPAFYYLYAYDASGTCINKGYMISPGPNTTWKDGDDYVNYRWYYDTTH